MHPEGCTNLAPGTSAGTPVGRNTKMVSAPGGRNLAVTPEPVNAAGPWLV